MIYYKITHYKRKAISSVVGLFFFIVVMVGAFTAFILMMETNTEFLNTQLDISQQELAKLQEDFVVFSETQPYRDKNPPYGILFGHNKFNITVDIENKGKTPIEVVNLWIINKTLPSGNSCEDDSSEPCEANIVEIDYRDSFVPVRSTVNILENSPVTMERGKYDLKVVTSLGNTEILPIRVGGPPLLLKLLANPPDVANLSNVTLTYIVTNNSTKTVYDVKPFSVERTDGVNTWLEFATVQPSTALQGINAWKQSGQTMISKLDPSETGSFTVNYRLTGAKGSGILFTSNVTAKKAPDSPSWSLFSNNDTTKVTMQEEATGSFGALRQKPEIFTVFPAPSGESVGSFDRGFFGAIIINPTNQTITVNRVSIFVAQGGGGTQVVIPSNEDSVDHISPIGKATCDAGNPSEYSTDPPTIEDNIRNGNRGAGGTNAIYASVPDGFDDPIGRYTFPENNLVVWTNDDTCNPVIIQPTSSTGFIFRTTTSPAGDLSAYIIGINAHTSAGQFANVGHTSSALDSEASATIINVFPTSGDVSGASEYDDEDDLDFIASGTIDANEPDNIFSVTIREAHADDANYLPATSSIVGDARLILKLPPGFPDFDVVCCEEGYVKSGPTDHNGDFCQYGFDVSDIVSREFRDGSIQVEVPLAEDLGDASNGDTISSTSQNPTCNDPGEIPTAVCTGECDSERFTFQFSVDGPDIDKDEIYVYYAFADGRDFANNPIGPVSEAIVLRVNGKEGVCFGKSPGDEVVAVDEFTGKLTGLTITCE